MTVQESDLEAIDALISRRRSRRPWLILGLLIIAAVIAVVAWLLTRPAEEVVEAEPQRVIATRGRLTTTIELSGSAAAASSADLTFAVGGTVTAIEVTVGQTVEQGDVLARLDDSEALRRLETAEVQLRLAEIALEELLDDPAVADLAAAERAVLAAEAQVAGAQLTLQRLTDPPDQSEIHQAEQSVANARNQLSTAEETFNELDDGPTAAELASAEQAVANARSQLSNAEQALNDLTNGPTAAELASAEQAVANARNQLSTVREALDDLTTGPTEAEVAAAEQAVASARNQLSVAEQALETLIAGATESELASAEQAVATAQSQLTNARQSLTDLTGPPREADLATARAAIPTARSSLATAAEEAKAAFERVEDAHERFCDEITVLPSTCAADLPLSTEERLYLEQESDGRGPLLERLADALLDAHLALDRARNAEESAGETLRAAEARLADLLEPAEADEIAQAEEAVNAAEANDEAARARLDDLTTSPDDDDRYQAEQSVAAAHANLEAAQARHMDLLSPATIDDLFQAEQAVTAASANLEAAQARFDDLRAEVDPDDRFQAEQTVVAARANYDAAVARLNDLRADPEDEDRFQAEQALAAAQANADAVRAYLTELLEPADSEEIRQAQSTLASAEASLEEAVSRRDELLAGSEASVVDRQTQNVRLAAITVEDAADALEDLVVRAQFAGVIEEISIEVGDRVSATTQAFVLSTRGRLVIELTVTEAEWFELEPGLVGVASFEALDDLTYAIRMAAPGRVPQIDQGVVTYAVDASILTPEELPDVVDQLAAVGGENAVTIGAEGASSAGVPNPFETPQAKQLLSAFESQTTIPPGVETLTVIRALAFDDPLPEGVILPENFQFPEQFKAQVRAAFLNYEAALAEAEASGAVEQPLPAPGMSASVTVITAIRDEAVHIAISAVRQIDGRFYVAIPSENLAGWERIEVEVGESDDSNVEILSGLDAGQVVLIGVDTEGVSYAAVLLGAG